MEEIRCRVGKAGQYYHCLRFVVDACDRDSYRLKDRLVEVRPVGSGTILTACDGVRLFQWLTPTAVPLEAGYYELKRANVRAVTLDWVGDQSRLAYPDWERVVRDFSRLSRRRSDDTETVSLLRVKVDCSLFPFIGIVVRAMVGSYINTKFLTNLYELGESAIPGDWSVLIRSTLDEAKRYWSCEAPVVFRSPVVGSVGRLRALIMPIGGDNK